MKTVLLIGTLDTKGPEIAYFRDRLQALGVGVIVADSGILAGPLDIVPDVSRAEVARLGGTTIETLRQAGSRGEAVHGMLQGLQRLSLDLVSRRQARWRRDSGRRRGRGARRQRHDLPADRHSQDHRHADCLGPAAIRAAGRHARRDGRALGGRHPRPQPDQYHHLRQRRGGDGGDARARAPAACDQGSAARRDHDAGQHHQGRDDRFATRWRGRASTA